MKELDIPMMNENCFAFFLLKEAEYRMYLCIHPKLTGGDGSFDNQCYRSPHSK